MKVLITGGSGFIGSHLAKFHMEHKDEVTVLDNLITGNLRNIRTLIGLDNFTFKKADVTTVKLRSLPKSDLIYHMASPASPIQYKKYPVETLMTNSLGTKRMLEYAADCKAKFLLASTSEVYGDPAIHPQTETYYGNVNSVGPRACYDEAKRFAEAMVVSFIDKMDVDARIVRIFNTYGPNMEVNDGRAVSNFITQALLNKPITIYGSGKQTRSFCYVSDLVRGLNKLATLPGLKKKVVNLGNPQEISINELAKIVIDMTGTKSKLVYEKESDENDPKKRKPDITKAKSLLNWKPEISLENGLSSTINYFKKIL